MTSSGKPGEYDPTITPTQAADRTRPSEPAFGAADMPNYIVRDVIGRGGMGEVLLAHDPRMDRDVALKRMLAERPSLDAEARFLREAKIQARLDHPAIVPVYELGRDSLERPFFAMKRLSGTTLAQLLERGEQTQRLLRALVDVCLAISLAHEHKIVHRDLKPSNIMLGDYGEVYVLDWGIARILDEQTSFPGKVISPSVDDTGTRTGQMLGTPGYMAPEQMAGGDVSTPADIYALGAIVFEILAGVPLHPRGGGAIGSTLGHVQTSPAERCPDRNVPFELDRVCRDALRGEPEARPTARELADRIQRYLDGDRDLERRRQLANEELAIAREAHAAGDRARTMRHAGRAMTLDPSCSEAVELATSLVLEAPNPMPVDVEERIAREEERQYRERSRRALMPFLAFFVFVIPILPWLQVRNWMELGFIATAIAGQIVVSYINWKVRKVPVALLMGYQLVVAVAFSRVASPFILAPAMAAGMVLSVVSVPWVNDRRWVIVVWATLALTLPFVIEAIGITDASWSMNADGIVLRSTAFARTSWLDAIGLSVANVMIVILIGLYARGIARDRRDAQRRLYAQTWHLEQLLPRRRAQSAPVIPSAR